MSAVNGIPPWTSVNHLSNIYPGIIAPWENDNIVYGHGVTSLLFRVDVTGVFKDTADEPISEYVQSMDEDSTNKWKITHVYDPAAPVSRISFTMNHTSNHGTINTKMRIYKAAVELEKLLLGELLPFATSQFDINVTASPRNEFDGKMVRARDSADHFTAEWLNNFTMGRVYTWITTVVPTFVRCWMPDTKIRTLDAFDTSTGQSQNGEQALSSNHNNVLIVVMIPGGGESTVVVDKTRLDDIADSDAVRHACKMTTIEADVNLDRTLRHTKLVDLQSLGTTHQVLVREDLLNYLQLSPEWGRVLCVFPSFDEFPGLLSAAAAHDQTSALHCNPGSPTIFRTSGITQCPGEALVKTAADMCQTSGNVFRIKKARCASPYETAIAISSTCCEIDFGSEHDKVGDKMRIYGNRTVDSSRNGLPFLDDAYEWFAEEFGIEGPITLYTDDHPDSRMTCTAFKHFMPNCPKLKLRFETVSGLAKAIEILKLATEHNLIYDAIVTVFFTLTAQNCLDLFNIFPQNETEIVFQGSGFPTIPTLVRIDSLFQTLEHRRGVVTYTCEDEGNFERVWRTMVMRGYRKFGPTSRHVVQLTKDHVQLTINTTRVHQMYDVSLRFSAGAKYKRVSMKENRRSTRKRARTTVDGGGASSTT